jgi:hypothetical protein
MRGNFVRERIKRYWQMTQRIYRKAGRKVLGPNGRKGAPWPFLRLWSAETVAATN